MELKARLMDEAQVHRSVSRIAHEIIENNHGAENICLLGVKRRGVPLARMIASEIQKIEGMQIPVGTVDISLYRDDLREIDQLPHTSECYIPVKVKDHTVILVDDVLYTGRTARSGIEAIIHYGRPHAIQLAVLIDRGHRELPIRADYVGKNVPTSRSEVIRVLMPEYDGACGADLYRL